MTHRQLVRRAVSQANKNPMQTLKRIARESDLTGHVWKRYKPLDKYETRVYTKK